MEILLTDSNQEFLNRLEKHIIAIIKDVTIYKTDNLDQTFSLLHKNKKFSFVFVNFDMLGKEWRHTTKKLFTTGKSAKFIFISENEDNDIVNYLLLSGCYGYIPPTYSDDLLSLTLSLMFNGCEYIPPAFLYNKQKKTLTSSTYRLPDGKTLTPRQVQVLNLLGEGLSNKQIAHNMKVSEATIKLHINALLKNLNVNNRTQAVVNAQKLGFL